MPVGEKSSAVGPTCRTLPLVDGVGVRPRTRLLLLLLAEGEGQVSVELRPPEAPPGSPRARRPLLRLLVLRTKLAVMDIP